MGPALVRRLRPWGLVASLLAVPFGAGAGGLAVAARRAAPVRHATVVVSLEFDHAFTDALTGVDLAAAHGMPVTLFAMSGRIGLPGYMTAAQLRALQAAGDEVGGHTIDHADLPLLTPAAQEANICADRTALLGDGLRVTDFAYPYGHFDRVTERLVRACGYESARGAGGLRSPGECCLHYPSAETIPPVDPFATRAVNSVLATTPLSALEGYVTHALPRGGWVQIVFHHVCDDCDLYSVRASTLSAFLDWLAGVARVRVETVRSVIEAPFVPRLIRVAGAGRTVTLHPFRACPATPVGASCRRLRVSRGALALPAGQSLLVRAPSATRSVSLLFSRGMPLRARWLGAGRWRVSIPAGRRGRTELRVGSPLGVASYRLVLR